MGFAQHDQADAEFAGPAIMPDVGRSLRNLARASMAENPPELHSPFEGVETIAGGVWRPDDLGDDALLLLRFGRGTLNLPLHSHEHSDRLIVVLAGHGRFVWAEGDPKDETSFRLQHVSVSTEDFIRFDRGVIHTFSTPEDSLLLLSYHRPYIALEDPRQFTVAGDTRAGIRAITWGIHE
jgi:mannose-6-phosphate isomerase-like protein (cupin superfamily)